MFTRLTVEEGLKKTLPGTRPRFLDPTTTINWTIPSHKGIVHSQNGRKIWRYHERFVSIRGLVQIGRNQLVFLRTSWLVSSRSNAALFQIRKFRPSIERNARFVSSRRGNKPKIIIRSLDATIVNLNRSSKRFLQGFSTAIIRLLEIPVVLLHPFPVSKFPSFPLRETLVGVLIRERIKRIENIFRANSFRHVSPTSCSFKFTWRDASAIRRVFISLSFRFTSGEGVFATQETRNEIRALEVGSSRDGERHGNGVAVSSRKRERKDSRLREHVALYAESRRVMPGSKKISRFTTFPSFLPPFRAAVFAVYRSL